MSRSSGIVAAIDVGTSAVKAGVFTADGHRLGYGTAPAPSLRPRPGWSEQPATRIWEATAGACRQALAEAGSPRIEAVAVTGARGSFALAGRDGRLLTDFITWQDRRALGQVAAAAALADAGWLQRITGVRMDASLWLPRLLWLIEHRRDLVAAAGCIVTPQAFVIGRLGAGHWPAEWSAAAYSGLFDIADHRWHGGLVDTFSVPAGLLPTTLPPGAEAGRTSPAASTETALPPRVPIVLAAADGPCAELGCGVVEPGRLICYLGTALSVAGPVERRIEDPSGSLITAPGSTRSLYRVLALGMAGASVLDWYGKLVGRPVLDRLDALMEGSVPGAGGARFIPALAGSGAPRWSAEARGAFLGLGFGHTEVDLVRAMLEGVAFECFWMIETLRPFGFDPAGLRVTGGGSRSNAWTQLMADIVGTEVVVPDETDPGLRGAAAYALVHAGSHPDVLSAARAIAGSGSARVPSPAATEALRAGADYYRDVRRAFARSGLDTDIAHVPLPAGAAQRPSE